LLKQCIALLIEKVEETADEIQIGRTHGQHALPVTVGFWLAEILDRVASSTLRLHEKSKQIVGKISGAVGAHNAQVGLGISTDGVEFEQDVLAKLGLHPAPISSQIVPPETLAEYLFTVVLISGALAKFGRDIRHLMRTEIGELAEPFEKNQVGSSTMAQKRNPVNAENIEGTFLKSKTEFGKVLDCLVSEHQRDLVGSTVMRDFPTIIVNLVLQLKTLLRTDKQGVSFLKRVRVDRARVRENFSREGSLILSEPLYIALQLYGFSGDAHKLVNEVIVERARGLPAAEFTTVVQTALEEIGQGNVWESIPQALQQLFNNPDLYTGVAEDKAREVCDDARYILSELS
jgi:adenylosuccinate lyase